MPAPVLLPDASSYSPGVTSITVYPSGYMNFYYGTLPGVRVCGGGGALDDVPSDPRLLEVGEGSCHVRDRDGGRGSPPGHSAGC